MPLPEIQDIAKRLEITLKPGEELTEDNLLSAIHAELRDLQVPEQNEAQRARHLALMLGREEIMGISQTSPSPSTDLVPLSFVSQVLDLLQKSTPQVATPSPPRPDPAVLMRTHVKAASTKASSDFAKKRSLPFAGAGALIASAYGLRTYTNVEDLKFSSDFFYPFFWLSVVAIVIGYAISLIAQRRAERMLRGFYNPDLQESALDILANYQDHDLYHDRDLEYLHPALQHRERQWRDDEGPQIFTRPTFRLHLRNIVARGSGPRFRFWPRSLNRYVNHGLDLLATVDLEAALDDAAELALDRLIELKIVESVVGGRRQGFRIIQ